MANAVAPRNVRALVLDLHTDLGNLDNYAGNTVLVGALLETAEAKLAIISQHLADVRHAAGLRPSAVILHDARVS